MGINFSCLKNLISRLGRFTATVIWITVIVQLSLSLTAQPALAQTFFETPKRVLSPIAAGQQTLFVISFNVESDDVEDTDPSKVVW